MLDDRLATISADEKAHRRRWAAWLYWGNIVQFLSDGAGDGDQIAYTNLEAVDPHLLASALKVADSAGLRTYYSLHRRSQAEAILLGACLPQTSAGSPVGVDVSWPVDLLAPEVGPLAHGSPSVGVPAPTARTRSGTSSTTRGGRRRWPGPLPRVAVIADGDEECVAAFVAAGWDARRGG